MQLFSAYAITLKKINNSNLPLKPWKKPLSIVAHNRPRPFFSVLPIGPNPAQILIPVPKKSPTVGLLYNDFACKATSTEAILQPHSYDVWFVWHKNHLFWGWSCLFWGHNWYMNFDIHHFADIVVWIKFGFGINAGPEKKKKVSLEHR